MLAQMQRSISAALLFASLIVIDDGSSRASADWLTLPSSYSHDSFSGERVAQFAPVEVPTSVAAQPLRSSGYTHYRSSLAYGQSADNYHKVEQWGEPVRPYGEWRFPYRPYSTPYPNWGAPFAGLNFNNNFIGSGAAGRYPNWPQHGHHPPRREPRAPHDHGHGNHGPAVPPGGGRWGPNPAAGTDSFSPYPAGRGTPYPVAPYYDGDYPNYRD